MARRHERAWMNGQERREVPPGHVAARLTPAQRDEIRRRLADGEATVLQLAAEYAVSVSTINRHRT